MVVREYRDNKLSIFDGLVVHQVDYKEPKRKDKYIPCECNSEVLRVSKWEYDDLYYLTVYSFSAEKYSLWERIKILFGGKVKTVELVLSEENYKKLKR